MKEILSALAEERAGKTVVSRIDQTLSVSCHRDGVFLSVFAFVQGPGWIDDFVFCFNVYMCFCLSLSLSLSLSGWLSLCLYLSLCVSFSCLPLFLHLLKVTEHFYVYYYVI